MKRFLYGLVFGTAALGVFLMALVMFIEFATAYRDGYDWGAASVPILWLWLIFFGVGIVEYGHGRTPND